MIYDSHPRAESLRVRELLIGGLERGIVARQGLLAHGRGEAFDYLVGEKTTKSAKRAARAAAAAMLAAERPVISVNGNVAAICPERVGELARATGAAIEANTFYDGMRRRRKIVREMKKYSDAVYGDKDLANLDGLDGLRGSVSRDGILAADLVLVPLEDGDRTEALANLGKTVIAIDLNPLSRTARTASITIVDEVSRAIPVLVGEAKRMSGWGAGRLRRTARRFDNVEGLRRSMQDIGRNLGDA